MKDGKVVIMAVYGVSTAAGAPVVFASQNLKNVQQPANAASAINTQPVAETNAEQTKSSKRTKALLTLATLGAITYGIIRYKNANALKPVIENFEKATKDGGKLTTQLTKNKVSNPDGTTTHQLVKSVKTHFDKEGKKHAEIIHDYNKHERYTVFYDKDGNVTKNIVSRMSVPTKNAKSTVEQQLINVFTRNGNQVTTNTSIIDYSQTPRQLYSFEKTEQISVPKN